MNLKIKEPDYKQLYESRQSKIDSLNKTISWLKGRITTLENENKRLANGFKGMQIAPSFKLIIDAIKEDANNLINKKMIKVHYAELTNQGDIPCLEFENKSNLRDFLFSKAKEDRVFLFAYEFPQSDGKSEVFVTEDITMIAVIIDNCFDLIQIENVFYLQEYPSFEEAYKVSLDMQETSQLCYNKIN